MYVFIGFGFAGGMPSFLFLSFFGLIVRYIYFKFAFIRYSRVPPAYNEALNDEMLLLMPTTLITHCLISIYMYGSTTVFASETSFLSSYVKQCTNIAINNKCGCDWISCNTIEQDREHLVSNNDDHHLFLNYPPQNNFDWSDITIKEW